MICGGAALLVSALFFGACLSIDTLAEKISRMGNINILVYGMTLVLFCLVFVAGMLVTGKWNLPGVSVLEKSKVKRGILAAFFVVQILFFYVMVAKETDQLGGVADRYLWHTQPLFVIALLFVAEIALFLWMFQKFHVEEKEGEWLVYLVYAVLTVLICYCMDTPNIFGRGTSGDTYHGHAYYNSIYNVYMGIPYTGEITSVYGHYALLWKIPMEIIKGGFRKFIFLQAMLGAFTHLCAFLTLEQLVKSKILRIMGALSIALPILGMRGGYYWQVWPHRMVFPMILLLYAVIVFKKQKFGWKTALPGYVISLMGVLWNTETGIVIAIAWAAAHLSRMLSEDKFCVKKFLGNLVFHGAGVVFSFFGAYGLVNLYNLSKHSPANTLEEFLMPLLSSSYMTDILHLDIPLFPAGYMPELVLFLMGVAVGISEWKWFRKERPLSWKNSAVFFLSISALGRLVYYINRPAYHNLDCCHLSAAILLAYFGEQGIRFIKEKRWKELERYSLTQLMKGAIGSVCAAALLATSTGTVLLFSQTSHIKNNLHNTEEIESFVETVSQQVPQDTFGFGLNVAEIYSYLYWNTQCYTMDFSDMAVVPQTAENLFRKLEEEQIPHVFTSKSSLPILFSNCPEGYEWFLETYELQKSLPISYEEFQLYVRKEQ